MQYININMMKKRNTAQQNVEIESFRFHHSEIE